MGISDWEKLDDHNPHGQRFRKSQHKDVVMVSIPQHIEDGEDNEKDVKNDVDVVWVEWLTFLLVHILIMHGEHFKILANNPN